MINKSAPSKKPGIIGLIFVLAVISICVITALTKKSPSPNTEYTKTTYPTKTITPTKVLSSLTFNEINRQSNNLTKVQWAEYLKQIEGSKVRWTGYVSQVSKSLGIYSVRVCIDRYSCSDDVIFICSEEESLQLNKKQKITFEGEISKNTSIKLGMDLNVILRNVVILEK